MRSFCLKLIGFGLLQTVLAMGLAYLSPPDPEGYLASVLDKHHRLETVKSPRLILIGGSNVAFGFDSEALGHQIQRTPVNMAVHAGLGADYILRESISGLRRGDLVLVSMEYSHFAHSTGSQPEIFEVIRLRPESFAQVRWSQRRAMLDTAIYYGSNEVRKVLRKGIALLLGVAGPSPQGVYQRSSFNEAGDVVGHHAEAPRLDPNVGMAISVDSTTISQAISRLNTFAQQAREAGAEVYFTYPCIPQPAYKRLEAPIRSIAEALRRQATFPILEAPEERVLPVDRFFDTPYHLTKQGAMWRTRQVAAVLEARRL